MSSFVGNVTVAIGTNPPGTGVLDGTVTVQAVGGVAEFSALDIDEAGTGYTLTANGGGLTEATSDPFTISAGAATQLVFTVPPANAAAAQTMAAVAVAAQDGLGNTDPSFTGQVTVAIQNNAGGGTLSGTVMVV